MFNNCGLENVDIQKNSKISLKQPRITMVINGIFELDKIYHLRIALERKGSQIKHTEWNIHFDWHAEASKRLQD